MLLTDVVKIKACFRYISILRKNSPNIKYGEFGEISIYDLPNKSKFKIDVCCDICKKNKSISISSYNKNIKNGGYYSCSQICSKGKTEITNLKKYGCHPSKIKENRTSAIITSRSKYGHDYMKSDIIKTKIINTNLFKYGVEYPLMSYEIRQKAEQTNLAKHGYKNPFQIDIFKEKIKKTNILKFGFENPQQSDYIHKKTMSSGFFLNIHENGLEYNGTYEKHFIDFCLDNSIIITKTDSICYEFMGKTKKYFPDFYYEKLNLIIEIKSDYTYLIDEEINISKKIACEKLGFKFLFIINKNYDEFIKLIYTI